MTPEKRLELVHLQITRNCNLRCWFCGQWGKKGFFSGQAGEEMTLNDWKTVIDDIIEKYDKNLPSVILWGGEPLVSPYFDELSAYLAKNGFSVGMVTNGVLLDDHIEVCKKYIKRIYLSIDGPQNVHDSIRGKGVFDRVKKNVLKLCRENTEVIIMSVLSPALPDKADEFISAVSEIAPDELILQEMIYVSPDEAERYSKWLYDEFGISSQEIKSWVSVMPEEFAEKKRRMVHRLLNEKTDFKITYLPHGEETGRKHCLSPFRHAHIAWNGNVLYCTDFYDYTAGNVKKSGLFEILNNEASEKFRTEVLNGKCAACRHCSWRNNQNFRF